MKFSEWLKLEGVDPKHMTYAQKHLQQLSPNQKVAMQEIIKGWLKTGIAHTFVDVAGITEKDKEKLSAYVVVADQMGYELGPWKYDRVKGTSSASAPIKLKV